MVYAVDFDGTIVDDNYPEIGKPRERVIHYLKCLKKEGHTLILWTCRVGKDLEEALEFCNKNGIEFDYINENTKEHIAKYGGDTRKIFADYYIDDKAMDFVFLENKRKVGDLVCEDVGCKDCPLNIIKYCGGLNYLRLYEILERWYENYKDDEIYNILKTRLDEEVNDETIRI